MTLFIFQEPITFIIIVLNRMGGEVYLILLTKLQYAKHILLCKNVSLRKKRDFLEMVNVKVSFIPDAIVINPIPIFLILSEHFR